MGNTRGILHRYVPNPTHITGFRDFICYVLLGYFCFLAGLVHCLAIWVQVVHVDKAKRKATVKLVPRIDLQAVAEKFVMNFIYIYVYIM